MDYVFGFYFFLLLFQKINCIPAVAENIILLDTMQDEWRGWKTNSGKYSGWRSQNIPPDGDKVFGICMVHRVDNDNWLYSPVIPTGESHSITIETYFSMRNCKNYPDPSKLKTCEDTIHLMTYETNEIKESSNQNNRLFKQTAVLVPQNKWSKGNSEQPTMNVHKVSIHVKGLGIRIGYRDTGSCTMVRRVRVFYLVCPEIVNSFTVFPRTVSKHFYELVSVLGSCVKGAIQKVENADQLQSRFCQSNGLWHDMGTVNCHCGPGFTASNDWKACISCASGTFKPIAGPIRCSYCPKFSQSESGQSYCECEKGYYRKLNSDINVPQLSCLQLPSPPRDLVADITDGSKVILSWNTPNMIDIMDHDIIEYYHISCYQCSTKKLQFLPAINVTETSVTIYGLNFGESYLFFVTSIASISNISMDIMHNPSQSSVRFFLPKTRLETIKSVQVNRQANSTYLISWAAPDSISQIELYLVEIANVVFSNKTGFETKYEYIYSRDSKCFYTPNQITQETNARVRYKSEGTWSDLSPEVLSNSILQENVYNEKPPTVNQSILPWIPNLDIVFLGVTSVVIIVIVFSVSIVLMRKYIFRNIKRRNCRKLKESSFVDNTKSSYASITASSPSRARSYFYLSSVDNLTSTTQKVLNEIQPEWINLKTLNKSGKFYDVYNGSIKQPRKLSMYITINVFKIGLEEQSIAKMLEDCRDISQFQHENIINILGFSTAQFPYMILLEYMSQGCLNSFLKINKEKLDLPQLLQFLHNIACGMHFLSERKFIHKKLSTYNVFIDESMVCKLSICLLSWCDDSDEKFGSKYIDDSKTSNAIGWMAPEVQLENTFSTASDVWAYGVTMWEVFSFGEKPYWDWAPSTISKVVLEGYRLPPPKHCYQNLHSLMLSCWMLETSLRPSFLIIAKNLDQLMSYVERQLLCLSQIDKINKSMDGLKSDELAHDCMHASLMMSKNNRNASLDNISIDNFQSLKQRQNYMSNKRSCSSIITVPSMELGPTLPNLYVSSNALKSSNFKEHYSSEKEPNDSLIKSKSFNSKINLNNWLSELNMKKYKKLLAKNGYSSRSKLAHISIADLTEMGIKKASEIQILMNNAHQLQNDFSI